MNIMPHTFPTCVQFLASKDCAADVRITCRCRRTMNLQRPVSIKKRDFPKADDHGGAEEDRVTLHLHLRGDRRLALPMTRLAAADRSTHPRTPLLQGPCRSRL